MEQSDVDIFIGNQLRKVRRAHGKSQAQLGELIGVSYQQVQKYERGTNRLSASALYVLAVKLEEDFRSFLPIDSATSNHGSILDAEIIDAFEGLTALLEKRQLARSGAAGTRRRS